MPSKLEALAPLLTAFPGADAPLTPDADRSRLESAIREVAGPDLECVMVAPDPAFKTEWRGVEGLLDAWADWLAPFERFWLEIEDVIESGDVVVTLVRQHALPRGGGREVENAGAAVWTFEEGILSRVEFHLDREVALKSAGLPRADV